MKKTSEYTLLLRSLGREWKWLFQYIRRYCREIFLYVLIGVIGTVMGLGSSVASKYLIDAVVTKSGRTIACAASLVIGLALVQIFINAGTSKLSSIVGTRVKNEIRGSIYEHIVRSRWAEINKYHSGDLINRLEGDVAAVSNGVITFIPNLVTRLTQFLGCLTIVLYYDPTMAIFALLSAPFVVLSTEFSARMMRKYNKEGREMNGKILSFSSESIQNLQAIKAFDLTRRYTDHFKALIEKSRDMRLAHDRFSIRLTLCMSVLGLIVSYSCYGWAVWRLWQGAITFGTMTLFIQISGNLTNSFSSLVSLAPGVIAIATAAGRIMEITNLPLEADRNAQLVDARMEDAKKYGTAVHADNVTYTYGDGARAVLNGISFDAAPGETIAFVGPSGEGKTTILRLILGLIEPDSGSMRMTVREQEIEITDSTRRFCSYVPQDNTIFSGSIADNLRLVAPEASDCELTEALKIAEAWDFVAELPAGMNTNIGERGVNFSEGQIQRISIARAVLRSSPVLVMDEATSALDAETEERLLHNLMASAPRRTCILTTHRPSMLQYCNRVYRLHDNGNLTCESPTLQRGNHNDLQS